MGSNQAEKNTGLILYYIPDGKKEKQVAAVCRQLGIQTRRLRPMDTNTVLGTLVGITMKSPFSVSGSTVRERQKAPGGYVLPELLVFSGLQESLLDAFLAEYKKQGLPPIGLKAVVTPYNLSWSVYQLAEELKRERIAMLLQSKKEKEEK